MNARFAFFGWSHGTIHGSANPQQTQQQCFMV